MKLMQALRMTGFLFFLGMNSALAQGLPKPTILDVDLSAKLIEQKVDMANHRSDLVTITLPVNATLQIDENDSHQGMCRILTQHFVTAPSPSKAMGTRFFVEYEVNGDDGLNQCAFEASFNGKTVKIQLFEVIGD